MELRIALRRLFLRARRSIVRGRRVAPGARCVVSLKYGLTRLHREFVPAYFGAHREEVLFPQIRLVYIGGILKVCGGAATIGGPPIPKLRLTLTFGWLWSFVIAPQASDTSARGARARLKQDRPPPKCLGLMGARPLAPYIHKPISGR